MLTALSLFTLYFLGLGLFACLIVPNLLEDLPKTSHDCARLLAILFLSGISLNYLIVLFFQGLATSLEIGSLLSLSGFIYLIYRRRRQSFIVFRLGWTGWLYVCYFFLLYAMPILFTPIKEWDARSNWFFHGKIIFYKKGIYLANIAKETYCHFSHLDYPKLLPVLAAQFANLAGYWNEFFPKASLMVLLIPILLGTFAFANRAQLSTLYLVFCLFTLGDLLWRGDMDGYLALYGALTLLFWGRWLASHHPFDFLAGILFLLVTTSMKNEGALLVISASCSLALISLFSRYNLIHMRHFCQTLYFLPLTALPLCNLLLWNWRKNSWGFENELALGIGSFTKILGRIVGGEVIVIGQYLLMNAQVCRALVIFLCGMLFAKFLRIHAGASARFALLSSFIYFTGIFIVYLATPADLTWHLNTSATRTMQTVILGLFVATYFVLSNMEGGESNA